MYEIKFRKLCTELKVWRVTETDLITICNGQWIGSEVSYILLTSVKHDKLFIFRKTITFIMKLLELEPTQKQREMSMFFNTMLLSTLAQFSSQK